MIPSDYAAFLATKELRTAPRGLDSIPALCSAMKPHQRVLAEFALTQGSSAGFVDTGLGKSLVELEFCRIVSERTGKPSLLLTPLAVAGQMKREADHFGVGPVHVVKGPDEVRHGINVTNFDRVEQFDPTAFGGVCVDESSILKGCTSKTLWRLIEMFAATPFRYAATATPAPNDHTELGNHAHFLGVMRMQEMLMRWFVHDSANTQDWRLKGHAVKPFWNWVASWARCCMKPSDFGFDDTGYDLPELKLIRHDVEADRSIDRGDFLFRMPGMSATEINAEKRRTIGLRAAKARELVYGEAGETWVVWCDTNHEADALKAAIPDAVEVRGSMSIEQKEDALTAFSAGNIRVLITKPSIAGFGLNWQHNARTCFVGLSYSYEKFYQAVRRFWRFGQLREVHAHCILADTEAALWRVLTEKQESHDTMKREMAEAMRRAQGAEAGVRQALTLNRYGNWPAFLEAA
jgi:hypothetical protein